MGLPTPVTGVEMGLHLLPGLRRKLYSEDPRQRIWAAYFLGEIGLSAWGVVEDLFDTFRGPDREVRREAARAVGKVVCTHLPTVRHVVWLLA